MQLARREISLNELPDQPDRSIVLSPRSRQACASEGVDLSELVYRPIEEFADRQLSPRIVKLRFDYFEAKRKDLLALAIAAREKLIQSKPHFTRSRSSSQTVVSTSVDEKPEWGMLLKEREKLARFQEGEKKWLENCLKHELRLLKKLEAEDVRLSEESRDSSKKMMEESRRMKELNDRRRIIEEQKQKVLEAQQELEKEKAKVAFAQHQQELERMQEKELQKKREAHERSLREAERRMQKETELREQQNRLWREKQEALSEMQKQDEERLEIIEKCKGSVMSQLHARRAAKEERVMKSINKNRELDKKRKEELVKKLVDDQQRDERLAIVKQEHMEEAAKKSFQLMLRRKIIQDESQRKSEERRDEMMAQQSELNRRLREHEEKKKRYHEFRKELESLREKNKQLNVDRQRKKEMYLRDLYAQRVTEKDSKIETLFAERQELWGFRRKMALESQKSRDFVKKSIMEMRIKSKIDSKKLETYVSQVLNGLSADRSEASSSRSFQDAEVEFSEEESLSPSIALQPLEAPLKQVKSHMTPCTAAQNQALEETVEGVDRARDAESTISESPRHQPTEAHDTHSTESSAPADTCETQLSQASIREAACKAPDSIEERSIPVAENVGNSQYVKAVGDDDTIPQFTKSLGDFDTHG